MTGLPDGDLQLALQTMLAGQATIQADVSALRESTAKALTHLEVIDQRNKGADGLHRDFEARIRILERFRYTLAGLSAVGGILAGAVGYWLGHFVK